MKTAFIIELAKQNKAQTKISTIATRELPVPPAYYPEGCFIEFYGKQMEVVKTMPSFYKDMDGTEVIKHVVVVKEN